MNRKIVPEPVESQKSAKKHTLWEMFLGSLFFLGVTLGLALIAINTTVFENQLAIGFVLILVSCGPGWLYFRMRKGPRVDTEKLQKALAKDFIIHKKED